ncbi:MAG: hypothetical protein ACT4PM_08175 [Gemmatimonadales bacterium]
MSKKRLQVILPDDEYRLIARVARRRGQPVAQVVRETLRRTLAEEDEMGPEQRIAAVLRFARFSGPTGSIQRILRDIERGRGLG